MPVIDDRSADVRAFFQELERQRKHEFDISERRIGITKESWYIQHTPRGDLLIGYMESQDFSRALQLFAQSQDSFDVWFKQRLAGVTGGDLNNPPSGSLSEQLSSYEAAAPGPTA